MYGYRNDTMWLRYSEDIIEIGLLLKVNQTKKKNEDQTNRENLVEQTRETPEYIYTELPLITYCRRRHIFLPRSRISGKTMK